MVQRIEEDDQLQVNLLANPLHAAEAVQANPSNAKTETPIKRDDALLYSSSLSSADASKQVIKAAVAASAPKKKPQNEDPDFWTRSTLAQAEQPGRPLDDFTARPVKQPSLPDQSRSFETDSSLESPAAQPKAPRKHINLQLEAAKVAAKFCDLNHQKIIEKSRDIQGSDYVKTLLDLDENLPEKGGELSQKAKDALEKLKTKYKTEFSEKTLKDPESLRRAIDHKIDEYRSNAKIILTDIQTHVTEIQQVFNMTADSFQNNESKYIVELSRGG